MHIPDNYLSPAACAVMGAAMAPVWMIAVHKVRKEVPKAGVPLLGIGAAFSFLLMMFNIPLPGGTTGHAVGGTLLAVALGPWSACLSMTIALLLQALMFGDGGILSFAANSFNMAFVVPFLGSFIFRVIRDVSKTKSGEIAGLAVGSYIGLSMAALCTAVELGVQPLLFRNAAGMPLYFPYPLSVSIPAIVVPHLAVAGIAEAVFTVAIFAFVRRVSPDTISGGPKTRFPRVYVILAALICLTPLGLLASGPAWGEWRIGEIAATVSAGKVLGYVPQGMQTGFNLRSLFPAYTVKGAPGVIGSIVSAIAGTAGLIIAFKLISLAARKKGWRKAPSPPSNIP
jgi:cobalt/nickel transport system permease protein